MPQLTEKQQEQFKAAAGLLREVLRSPLLLYLDDDGVLKLITEDGPKRQIVAESYVGGQNTWK